MTEERPTLDDLVNAQTAYIKASEAINARKLARLIEACKAALTHLAVHGCSPAFTGGKEVGAAIMLRAAIEEAKR